MEATPISSNMAEQNMMNNDAGSSTTVQMLIEEFVPHCPHHTNKLSPREARLLLITIAVTYMVGLPWVISVIKDSTFYQVAIEDESFNIFSLYIMIFVFGLIVTIIKRPILKNFLVKYVPGINFVFVVAVALCHIGLLLYFGMYIKRDIMHDYGRLSGCMTMKGEPNEVINDGNGNVNVNSNWTV